MQPQTPRYNYLLAEVATATPQKLQLLLIEAAMKNIYRVKAHWAEQKYDVAFDFLVKAQDIVAEILCSFDRENSPDLAKKLSAIYVFIFRRLAEGGMSHNPEKLDDALRVLASERETWRLVCEKFGSSVNDTKSAASHSVALGKPGQAGTGTWASAVPVSAPGTSPSPDSASFSSTPTPVDASKIPTTNGIPRPTPPRPLQQKPLQPVPIPPSASGVPATPKSLADFAPAPTRSGNGKTMNLLDPHAFPSPFPPPKR